MVDVGNRGDLGLSVTIRDHAGQVHELNHLSAIAVQPGAEVMAGDLVGAVGSTGNSTGPHLDYRVRGQDGDFTDPMSNPAIAQSLDGKQDMSDMDMSDLVGTGAGEDDPNSGNWNPDSDSGWNPGDQYNQQTDNGWQQVTVGDDGGYSTTDIDPSDYSNYGIPTGNSSSSGNNSGGFDTSGTAYGQQTNVTTNPFAGQPGQNSTAAMNAAGYQDTPAGRAAYAASQASNPYAVSTTPTAQVYHPTSASGSSPNGVYTQPYNPAQVNAQADAQIRVNAPGYANQLAIAQGGWANNTQLAQMGYSAQAQQQTAAIQANELMQQRQLDAAYQQALLSAKTQEDLANIQDAYNRYHDQIQQQSLYKQLQVQQDMQTQALAAQTQQQAAAEASQERIAGTGARANVLGTWGRAAASSPWLSRLSGRAPAPGDTGSGTGYGAMSTNTQNLLQGGANGGGQYTDYLPGGQASYSGQAQGWGGASSGGGDWPMFGEGAGEFGGAEMALNVPGANPNEWGDASGSRLPNSIFGSGAGDFWSDNPTDQDVGSLQASDPQIIGGDSGKMPIDTTGDDGSYTGPTNTDTSGLQSDTGSGDNNAVKGGGFSYYYNTDQSAPPQAPAPAAADTTAPAASTDPAAASTDTSTPAASTTGTTTDAFGNTIDDLSGGAPPSAPSLADWENMGPFGQAALRYGLESAGYNWAPYSEAMLQGWRDQGQADPNTGMSGYTAPHVTALGLQSMNPLQQEALQQNAELFGTWGDYQNREQRAWQTGARPMTNVKA